MRPRRRVPPHGGPELRQRPGGRWSVAGSIQSLPISNDAKEQVDTALNDTGVCYTINNYVTESSLEIKAGNIDHELKLRQQHGNDHGQLKALARHPLHQ